MRPDMHKVIVERPRVGHGDRYHPRRSEEKSVQLILDDEGYESEAASRGKLRPRGTIDRKSLNENLSPLRRWLEGQVGRSWNKVYAEVCAQFGRTDPIQLHVFQHLLDYVERTPMLVRKGILFLTHQGYETYWRSLQLYVDPQGILRRFKKKEPQKATPPPAFVRKAENVAYVLLEGVWYEVGLEDIKTYRQRMAQEHPLFGYSSWGYPSDLSPQTVEGWPSHLVATTKRQLSSAEIKRKRLNKRKRK